MAVGTKVGGSWSAAGGSGLSEEAARYLVTANGEQLVTWVEVEVLVPVEPVEVGATVGAEVVAPQAEELPSLPPPPQEPPGSG